MWSVKTHCVARVLLVLAGKKFSVFMEKIVTMIPTNLLLQISYKIAFISFLFSRRIQKQESNFWRVGDGLVTRNISVFYL